MRGVVANAVNLPTVDAETLREQAPYAGLAVAMGRFLAQMAEGRMAEARRTQEFAVALRPGDPAFVFNLALVCRAQGDLTLARRCCDKAIALDGAFAPAERLREELARQP